MNQQVLPRIITDTCYQCYDCFGLGRRLVASCGHTFHFECLKNLSNNNGAVILPICPWEKCKQTITSYVHHGNRLCEIRAGTTFKEESRIYKSRRKNNKKRKPLNNHKKNTKRDRYRKLKWKTVQEKSK